MNERSSELHDSSSNIIISQLLKIPVMVAALGYMVDMYDLFLFSIVRVPSLKALNLTGDSILKDGLMLLNLQMAGLLIGGIVPYFSKNSDICLLGHGYVRIVGTVYDDRAVGVIDNQCADAIPDPFVDVTPRVLVVHAGDQ